jgi:antitoxin HicB
MKIEYPAKITQDEDGKFLVEFEDLEEAFTEGGTLEEALFNANEVLSLCLEHRLAEKKDIPDPSKKMGKDIIMVVPDTGVQVALLIRKNRADKSLAELARVLETSWPSAQRLENPNNSPSLKMIDKVASVLGKRLVLSFE